jgi:hypothetical protein
LIVTDSVIDDALGKNPAVHNAGLQQPDAPGMKLGKLQARFLKGLPYLGVYTAELPLPPGSCDYTDKLAHLGLMANDRVGDCTCATIGHAIELWTSIVSTETILPDSTIIELYSEISGYVPGDSNTDTGAVLSEVLLHWYKHPVANHALSGFASIRPGNRTSIRDAIYLFGACAIGIQLPLAIRDGRDWILPPYQVLTDDWAVGSWGGHAIPACAYDADGVTVITWGKLLKVGWSFLDAYCDEAYGLLSRDWMSVADNSPPGFTWAALEQDMNSLRVSP